MWALPVDALRILIGLIALGYFVNAWRESSDFGGPQGLINHELVHEMYWFTRLCLFPAEMSLDTFRSVLALAMLACAGVVIGWRVRLCALVAFCIAVSMFRWNFITGYVEDAIVDVMLFWLLLLPVGQSLTLRTSWRESLAARVPAAAVRFFIGNLMLVYVVAGLWKWTSPMWRDGTAMYAILKLPVSRMPDFWILEHLPWLKLVTWSALVLEPLFALAFLLRAHHPLKYLFLLGMIAFHGGIVLTMRLPFANLACLSSGVLLFGPELMNWLRHRYAITETAKPALSAGWREKMAGVFLLVLTLSTLRFPSTTKAADYNGEQNSIDARGVGGVTGFHLPLYALLWSVGIAQQYQLFDWIDVRNYHFDYEITEEHAEGVTRIDPAQMFPISNRCAMLQAYLHDLRWQNIPAAYRTALQQDLARRFASRYAHLHAPRGVITVASTLLRITAKPERVIERPRQVLFRFRYEKDQVIMLNELTMTGGPR